MDDRFEASAPHPEHQGSQRPVEQQAREAVGSSAERVRQAAESQKDQAAGRLEGTAEALHQAASALHDRNESSLASYVEQFAGVLSEFSGSLRERSAGEVLGQVESIARRNPALFLGGAFAAGIALGRFARSSARHEHPRDEDEGTDRPERADHPASREARPYEARPYDDERVGFDDDRSGSQHRDDAFGAAGSRDERRDMLGTLPPHGDPIADDADVRQEPLGSEPAPRTDMPGDPSI